GGRQFGLSGLATGIGHLVRKRPLSGSPIRRVGGKRATARQADQRAQAAPVARGAAASPGRRRGECGTASRSVPGGGALVRGGRRGASPYSACGGRPRRQCADGTG